MIFSWRETGLACLVVLELWSSVFRFYRRELPEDDEAITAPVHLSVVENDLEKLDKFVKVRKNESSIV